MFGYDVPNSRLSGVYQHLLGMSMRRQIHFDWLFINLSEYCYFNIGMTFKIGAISDTHSLNFESFVD